MSVSPNDFLVSAKKLNSEATEISMRNAISRAYYAGYHRVQTTFPPDMAFSKTSCVGVHETYIEQLMRAAPGTTEREAAVKLRTMKSRRTIADYRLSDEIKPYFGAMQISLADEVFNLLNNDTKHLPRKVMEEAPESEQSSPVAPSPSILNKPTLKIIQ